ncbi:MULTISPECIES: hypothetical protein [Bradyrhizobium]|uniref:hypothetical protein n=1 Tax=Bradyrhizobium TaxID=374 RepID=UPI00041692CF|nr:MULTISPECIES: hypothetical protein [Bradyrhizobium]RZN35727.1 hypothetical protein CWO90_02525 [Bradyrhizobium sp. Leo121]
MRELMFILDVTFNNKTLFASRRNFDRLYRDQTAIARTVLRNPKRLPGSITTTATFLVASNGGITRA